jgi:hypothetical protein
LQPERAFAVGARRSRLSASCQGFGVVVIGLTEHGRGAEEFVHALGEAALAAEIREIQLSDPNACWACAAATFVLALARGGGNVEAPQFQVVYRAGPRSSRFHACAVAAACVVARGAPARLPGGFDEVFPVGWDEVVVPSSGAR